MIAVDTNILVYAHRADHEFHATARKCVTSLAEGRGAWAIPWSCMHEFYGVVTNRRIFPVPTPRELVFEQIAAWLVSPNLSLLQERGDHWTVLRELLDTGQIAGPMVHDARVAAVCIEHGVSEFWSADRDFNRFPQLTVRNPLIA